MNITEKLDLAIKVKETGSQDGSYDTIYEGKKVCRKTYMTKPEWDAFEDLMKKDRLSAHVEYSEGDGGELKEKNGRPPKMASYGSSSRLIYNLSRENENFHYEKKLHTTVGGTANLDGFLDDGSRYVFVEAKCHEPYSAKKTTVSKSYKKLYDHINKRMADNLRIEHKPGKSDKEMIVEYYSGKEMIKRFDMKQMICHLLGIATGMLDGTLERKRTDFIYLLYDPTELELSGDTKATVDKIYRRTCCECNLVDFSELLRVIFEYLIKLRYKDKLSADELDDLIGKFKFILASQDYYPILIR